MSRAAGANQHTGNASNPEQTLDNTIIVDNTILCSVAKCDTQATLRHVLGLTSRTDAAVLVAGQAIHHGQAAYFLSSDEQPAKAALRAFNHHYKQWASDNVDPTDRMAWSNIYRCYQAWLKRHPIEQLPWVMDKQYVETPLHAPLGTIKGWNVVMVGILDGGGELKHGSGWYIVDHKSARSITDWWKNKQQMSSQFDGYTWLVEHTPNMPKVTGIIINGIGVPKLSTYKAKCPKHKVLYSECATAPEHCKSEIMILTKTKMSLDIWEATARELVKRYISLVDRVEAIEDIKQVHMNGKFNDSCTFCEFKDFCRLGRPVHMVKGFFVENRWEPEKHALARQRYARKLRRRHDNSNNET